MEKIKSDSQGITNKLTEINNRYNARQKQEINLVFEQLVNDLGGMKYDEYKKHLNTLISSSTPEFLIQFTEKIINSSEPKEILKKIAYFFIKSNRPVYNLMGVKLVKKIGEISLLPLITPFIFNPYDELNKFTYDTIIYFKRKIDADECQHNENPANIQNIDPKNMKSDYIEIILNEELKTRSIRKKKIIYSLLKILYPDNIKLAKYSLKHPDFMEKIRAIEILGKTKDKKYLRLIEPFVLNSSTDIAVRKVAIESIAKIGGRKSKEILNIALHNEEHKPLRQIIYSGLEKN